MADPAIPRSESTPGGAGVRWSQSRTLVFGDGTADGVAAVVPIGVIPANVRVLRARADVTTAFDGTTDLLSIGYSGDVTAFFDTTEGDITNADLKDSYNDAEADSSLLGRDPQAAEYTINGYLETNAGTTAGEVEIKLDMVNENLPE